MKRAALIGAYLGALLAVDAQTDVREQLALGALTWFVLILACSGLDIVRRAEVVGVILFATVGETTGSLVWGVYRYRLHNLPLFIPPAHGLVYLAGVSLAGAFRDRPLVCFAALVSTAWALLGLTGSPRLDVAGAAGVALLCVFLWRSRARARYAGVFVVAACLELYGTGIGTWHWAPTLPGLGIPDGNPPSGAAAGYVWFDVMGLLVTPWLLALAGWLRTALAQPSPTWLGRNLQPEQQHSRN